MHSQRESIGFSVRTQPLGYTTRRRVRRYDGHHTVAHIVDGYCTWCFCCARVLCLQTIISGMGELHLEIYAEVQYRTLPHCS